MKKKSIFICSIFFLGALISCKTTAELDKHTTKIEKTSDRKINDIALNGKVYSAIWQQKSAEFKALCYQAYNVATIMVSIESSRQHVRPIAIITDVDETILDNSPYAVTQAKKGNEFDQNSWLEWTSKGKAIPYPGALDFFNFAASKNVTVFYISNRNENDKAGTLKNLKNLGFPFADEAHLLVMKDTSNKEARRKAVAKKYQVFMYLGDNLSDFSEVFYKKPQQERNQKAADLSSKFGTKFIVLPNSGYGDWETALPGYKHSLTPAQKDSVFLKNLKGY